MNIAKMAVFVLVCMLSTVTLAQEPRLNILAGGRVVASGYEGVPQYIYEGDFDATPVLTRNGQEQNPAFIGVLKNRRMTINSAVFYGGPVYEDGGWFDSEAEPVEFQIMANPGDDWNTAAVIEDYPQLDGTDMAAAAVHTDSIFEVEFSSPLSCVGFRVAGKGSSGNVPGQSFISINEIRAFGELGEPVETYTPPRLDGAFPIASDFSHPLEQGIAVGEVLFDGRVETWIRCEEVDVFDMNTFFGFYSANPLTLNSVSFIHGALSTTGGWFVTEDAKPTVEIRRTLDSDWEAVGTIESYPTIELFDFREDIPDEVETTEYTFTFSEPTDVMGVRIIGRGSFEIDETPFVQIGEIMIDGEGSPAFNGPPGTGFDPEGNPFSVNEDGILFVEAEFGRPFNEGFEIMPHGNANNGFVVQGAFGPSFNEYSGQGIEFEIEIPADADYYMFVSGNAPNTWGDSLFVAFEDDPGINPDSIASGDITWRPPVGDSPENFERDWFSSDTLGQDSQEFFILSAGTHTLSIGLREPRYVMDWFVLTTDPVMDIATFEPPASQPPLAVRDYSIY